MMMFERIRRNLGDARHHADQRAHWRRADTLRDLAERGAQWCRGEIGAHPSGYDAPAFETAALLPVLERANRAGFFTYQSQPGDVYEEDGQTVETRAFVEGFLDRASLPDFREAMGARGLLVLDSLVHDEPTVRYSERGEAGGRWLARAEGRMSHVSRRAQRALADAADLTVIDTAWGRNDVLWAALNDWTDAWALGVAR